MRLSAPLRYLWISAAWFFGIFGLLLFLGFELPVFRPYLFADSLISGHEVGIVLLALRAILVKSVRADIDSDLLDFIRPHLTATGAEILGKAHPCFKDKKEEEMGRQRDAILESAKPGDEVAAFLQSESKFQDLMVMKAELPPDAWEIVGAYSDAMLGRKPASSLPYPKERIGRALETALEHTQDPEIRRALTIGLASLKLECP